MEHAVDCRIADQVFGDGNPDRNPSAGSRPAAHADGHGASRRRYGGAVRSGHVDRRGILDSATAYAGTGRIGDDVP